jgi:hypothetical protein
MHNRCMRIFVSWSGQEVKPVASLLSALVGTCLGSSDVFFSDDIVPGGRPLEEIDAALIGAEAAFVLVSQSTMRAPWLNYELGSLGARIDRMRVIPILLDLSPGELISPVSQYGAMKYDDEAKLLNTLRVLNANRESSSINPITVETTFSALWGKFVKDVKATVSTFPKSDAVPITDREMLERIIRTLESQTSKRADNDPVNIHTTGAPRARRVPTELMVGIEKFRARFPEAEVRIVGQRIYVSLRERPSSTAARSLEARANIHGYEVVFLNKKDEDDASA